MISVYFQGKPFSITVIQVYVPTTNAKEAEVERFYDLLELTPKTYVLFFIFHQKYVFFINTKKICPFAFHWNAKV